MGSEGRRSADYRRIRAAIQAAGLPCTLRLPGCTGTGTTVDHDPPLLGRTEAQWRAAGGTYRPACSHCQSVQGARITNAKRRPARTPRRWAW